MTIDSLYTYLMSRPSWSGKGPQEFYDKIIGLIRKDLDELSGPQAKHPPGTEKFNNELADVYIWSRIMLLHATGSPAVLDQVVDSRTQKFVEKAG